MTKYTIIIGEKGNSIGHVTLSEHYSDNAAIQAARKACRRTYKQDGWWIVRCGSFEWKSKKA